MEQKIIKGWKDVDEQIELLISRGLIIEDKNFAKDYLLKVGYYRLSGYWYPFRKKNSDGVITDEFESATTFENIVNLYLFDKKLKLFILDGMERIELYFQTQIAYLLGERNPLAHLCKEELHGNFLKQNKFTKKSKYDLWLDKYQKQKERFKNKDFVKHNIKKYDELPIWVAIEIFDFGSLSIFYEGMKYDDKEKIQQNIFNYDKVYMDSWLRSFNYIRNISAHHSRLWNSNIVERAKIPRSESQLISLEKNKIFLYICIMQLLLKQIYPELDWARDFKKLLGEFPSIKNNKVSIYDMGIPDDWKKWNIWKK